MHYYANRHKKVIYSEQFWANEFETNNLSNSVLLESYSTKK